MAKKCLIFLGMLTLLCGCFTIHEVHQPATVTAGESTVISIDVTTNTSDANPKKAVVCIMVPTSWVVDSAAMISDYYTASAEEPLEIMDDAWRWSVCAEKYFPSGPDMKWVCMKGTEGHTAPDETLWVEGKFYITAGETPGDFALSYLVSDTGLFDLSGDTAAFDPDYGPGSAQEPTAYWDSSFNHTITVVGVEESVVLDGSSFYLVQNEPNPFCDMTSICYALPIASHVTMKIYDIVGEPVKTLVDRKMEQGTYTEIWDGRNNRGKLLPNGIYFYSLATQDRTVTKKLLLLR